MLTFSTFNQWSVILGCILTFCEKAMSLFPMEAANQTIFYPFCKLWFNSGKALNNNLRMFKLNVAVCLVLDFHVIVPVIVQKLSQRLM